MYMNKSNSKVLVRGRCILGEGHGGAWGNSGEGTNRIYNHGIWVIHVRNVIKPIHAFLCADKIVSINNF